MFISIMGGEENIICYLLTAYFGPVIEGTLHVSPLILTTVSFGIKDVGPQQLPEAAYCEGWGWSQHTGHLGWLCRTRLPGLCHWLHGDPTTTPLTSVPNTTSHFSPS